MFEKWLAVILGTRRSPLALKRGELESKSPFFYAEGASPKGFRGI
ncbi:hypothetical protein NSP_400 [Nodularia spumigena CCY9414]|nr:hypothetical protein NSP_400 [Nodularia spumigena CCY9414]